MIYLDHQASTPVKPTVMDAMQPYFAQLYGNPHSDDHAAGWRAADAVDEAREQVADRIGCLPSEVTFTSGATESNNLAILGLGRGGTRRRKIVVSAIEHKSVLAPAREMERNGFELSIAPVSGSGEIDLGRLAELVDEDTLLVSAMVVNNEVGTLQPISEISTICHAKGAILHCDGAQAMSWLPIDVFEMGIDLLSVSGHKFGAPKGIGALYVRDDLRDDLIPLQFGGEQERGLRAGTLPTPLCVALGQACCLEPTSDEVSEWRERSDALFRGILRIFPDARRLGTKQGHPGNVCVRLPGKDAETLIANIQPQVAASRGSACTSGIPEPSHVLRALGMTATECAETLRFSTSPETAVEEIEEVCRHIASTEAVEEARTQPL